MDSSDYNSMYNGLQLRFSKRNSYGLTFMGNYSYSSNKTQNGCRYLGNCALDYYSPGTTHTFATAFSYDLPIPTGHRRLGKMLLGGWTLGGTVSGSTGSYGSIADYNCAEFNYGSATCYANFTGGSPYSSNKGQAKLDSSGSQLGLVWLDSSKFVRANQTSVNGAATTLPGVGQRLFLGNATVGVFKGPASFMLNSSLNKDFAITERIKANYRLEAFNMLNHTVLNAPGGTVGPDMSNFGVITSAWDPRKLQMSARFTF